MTLAKLLVAIGASTSGFKRGLAAAEKSVDRLERRTSGLRRGFGRATGAMAGLAKKALLVGTILATVLTGGLIASTNAAIQWEDAFAGVRKTVEATPAEFAELEKGLRDLATTIPISATELAGLAETAGALGVAKDQILEFTRVTALIGVTTNVTSDEAADALGRLSNILGLADKDYSRFGSTLVALGNAGASTEAEILSITKRMGAAGKVAGLSTPQILGWASAIASVSGMEPERAGTSLQMFLIDVTKMASKSGKDLNLLAKTAGVSAKQFKKLFAKDANSALLLFIKGLGKLSKAQKLAVLDALGFKDSGVTRALLGMADAAGEVERQVNLAGEAWKENTALTDEAEKRFATTKSQLAILKNILFDIAITIGDAVLPVLTPMIKGLGEWITANRDLIAQFAEKLVTLIGQVADAIGRWLDENGPLIDQVAHFAGDVLVELWNVLTTQVVPAVVTAVKWIRDNLVPAFQRAWTWITENLVPALLEMGRQIFEYVVPKVQEFIDTLTRPGGVIESIMKVAGPVVGDLITSFGKIVSALFGGEKERGLVPALGDLIGVLWGDGTGPLPVAIQGAGAIIGFLVNTVIVPAIKEISKVVDALSFALDKLKELVGFLAKNPLAGLVPGQDQLVPSGNGLNLPKLKSGPAGWYFDFKAAGGPLEVNRPTFVGEKGPELITTSRAGMSVVPNGELGGRGGDTYHVTINNPTGQPAEEDIGFSLRRAAWLGGWAGSPAR